MASKCKFENKNGTCGLKGSYAYRHKCFTEDLCVCCEPPSNADIIRSMSDEELAEFLLSWVDCHNERHLCCPTERRNFGKCDGRCVNGRINWLRQPAKEETL